MTLPQIYKIIIYLIIYKVILWLKVVKIVKPRERMRAKKRNPPCNHPHSSSYYPFSKRSVPNLPWRSRFRESRMDNWGVGLTIFVKNLPSNMSNLFLKQLFQND